MNIINTYGIAVSISMLSKICRDGTTISFAYEHKDKRKQAFTSKVISISYSNEIDSYDGWHWIVNVLNEDGKLCSCVLYDMYDVLVLK